MHKTLNVPWRTKKLQEANWLLTLGGGVTNFDSNSVPLYNNNIRLNVKAATCFPQESTNGQRKDDTKSVILVVGVIKKHLATN